jgi:hypothetical protein
MFVGSPTVILHPEAGGKLDAKYVLAINFGIKNGPNGVLVPVCVGITQAREFIASLGKSLDPYELASFGALRDLLIELKGTGVTHVNFNPDRNAPNPVPIDEVIEHFRDAT